MLISRLLAGRRGTAALEFALVAPVMVILILGVFDITRAMIVWEQSCNAAGAIAAAAKNLSVLSDATETTLTATQMQSAMSAVYAEIPKLNLGNGTGTYSGAFSVTLSSVVYLPLCSTTAGCAAQTPYTLWSAALTEGGSQLVSSGFLRPCSSLTAVSTLANSSTRLSQMLNPALASGAASMTLVPQIVADVRYVYTPILTAFLTTVTFWATAAVPAPINGTVQEVTFNTTAPTGSVVSCTLPAS